MAIPPIGVLLLWVGTPPEVGEAVGANFTMMNLFKDGQLAWIAAGMCAAALYEFVDAIVAYNAGQKLFPVRWFIVIIPPILSILGAMFVAAAGAVYSTDNLKEPKQFFFEKEVVIYFKNAPSA